jgi:hypothetical protein
MCLFHKLRYLYPGNDMEQKKGKWREIRIIGFTFSRYSFMNLLCYIYVQKTFFFFFFCIVVLGGGILWHLLKFLQCIKCIILEFIPSTFITHPPFLKYFQ